MHSRWLVLGFAALLGACGTDEDSRPANLETVTLTVLSPSCGQPQCHSSATRTEGYAFDTIHDSNAALLEMGVGDSVNGTFQWWDNDLWGVITANGIQRMPPDAPLAADDITLIGEFLRAGGPGLELP